MNASTLTERYIHEVVRRIPADQRDDVAEELRATIADTIDGRDEADAGAAERAVLNEMGDPIRLATRYADRPQSLIGPELFPAYLRLVTMLLSIVLPIVVAVVMGLEAFDTRDIGKTIGAGVGAILTVGAQLIAWPTVIFWSVERFGGRTELAAVTGAWSVDKLPERHVETRRDLGDTVPNIVWHLLLIAALAWNFSYVNDSGDLIHVLDQSLWSVWLWPMLAGLAGTVVVDIARIAKGRWTYALVGWHTAAQVAFVALFVWLLSQRRFLSAEFITDIKTGSTIDILYTAVAIGVLAVTVYEIGRRFRSAKAAAKR